MVLKRIKKHGARFSAYLIAFFSLKLAWWIDRNFGSPTFEQIIFHLQFGADGLIETDPGLLRSFALHCVLSPLAFTFAIFAIQKAVLSERTKTYIHEFYKKRTAENTSQLIAKLLTQLRKAFLNFLPISLVIVGAVFLTSKLAIWSHLKNYEESEFFENNYVEPSSIISPKHKKNLVLIYIESLENGFSNTAIMGKDSLSPLRNLISTTYKFSNYLQTYGTGWTIAGIVSTQCGIPLKKFTTFDGNVQGEKFKRFLPRAICLGDVLSSNGYTNVFLQGGSLDFSGTGKFFSQHGYSRVLGKEDWQNLGHQDFNNWGLYDDQLFQYAKDELDTLEKAGKPYNLTFSTIDTHAPNGYISPTCKKQGVVDYKGIVNCTASLAADFITHMKNNGYLENTVVVVLGDHLAMKVPVYDQLEKFGNRTIFNAIITKESLSKNTETLYPFSMYPTILYTLGFRFEKNRLALGSSGFGPIDPSYNTNTLSPSSFSELLSKASKRYNILLK